MISSTAARVSAERFGHVATITAISGSSDIHVPASGAELSFLWDLRVSSNPVGNDGDHQAPRAAPARLRRGIPASPPALALPPGPRYTRCPSVRKGLAVQPVSPHRAHG